MPTEADLGASTRRLLKDIDNNPTAWSATGELTAAQACATLALATAIDRLADTIREAAAR